MEEEYDEFKDEDKYAIDKDPGDDVPLMGIPEAHDDDSVVSTWHGSMVIEVDPLLGISHPLNDGVDFVNELLEEDSDIEHEPGCGGNAW